MTELTKFRQQMRQAVADYIWSEGCECCADRDNHPEHQNKLGRMLNVRKYADGSGYDFSKYRTKKEDE